VIKLRKNFFKQEVNNYILRSVNPFGVRKNYSQLEEYIILPVFKRGDKTESPLWSSGQNSWLQIRRPGFYSRHYQKKKVVGLERGPLILMSTTEELLDR
jgi:hypothetical protein